jgi:hypothetical protein
MPAMPVIKNSNNLDSMPLCAGFGAFGGLARFPLIGSHTVIFSNHWELKMVQHEVENMNVSLVSGDDGLDLIAIKLAAAIGGEGCSSLSLTPNQARMLATELISAVNRAEVKSSLKSSPNLWRRQGEARPRLATA